jgi:hypothetical protein
VVHVPLVVRELAVGGTRGDRKNGEKCVHCAHFSSFTVQKPRSKKQRLYIRASKQNEFRITGEHVNMFKLQSKVMALKK